MKLRIFMATLCGILTSPAIETDTEVEKARRYRSFALVPAIIAFAKEADKVEVFEGLPHQTWEGKALKQEAGTKPTLKIRGFPFYKTPQPLRPAHRRWFNDVLGKKGALQPFGGFKMCGGFHPDYCLRFSSGKNVLTLQICFGCCEMQAHAGEKWAFVDIGKAAKGELKKILRAYEKNRPARTNDLFEP